MEAECLVDRTRRHQGPGGKTIERGREVRGGIWRGDGGKEEVAYARAIQRRLRMEITQHVPRGNGMYVEPDDACGRV